jgi:hypothetical protein
VGGKGFHAVFNNTTALNIGRASVGRVLEFAPTGGSLISIFQKIRTGSSLVLNY